MERACRGLEGMRWCDSESMVLVEAAVEGHWGFVCEDVVLGKSIHRQIHGFLMLGGSRSDGRFVSIRRYYGVA